MTAASSQSYLSAFIKKLEQEKLPAVVIDTFSHYYQKVVSGETGLVREENIEPVGSTEFESAESLTEYEHIGQKAFKQAIRITLNGGLGTSMGLTGAKSLLPVKNGKTFLDIIIHQSRRLGVKLALMNSFNTDTETLGVLKGLDDNHRPLTFLQHKFPKILRQSFKPAVWPQDPAKEWNPPGHGDVYTALYTSGMLKQLIEKGVRFAFISNSDNLGANMDAGLLGYFAQNRFPFMMEVAVKTPADVKGGHLARLKNGRLVLREAAQCPEEDVESFRDIQRYPYFNTNNIWVNLEYLMDLFNKEHILPLPMILNPKTLDPRDGDSPRVFQIETAMGAAISLFAGATAVSVPRNRFFPVKQCNDLLAVRSDCFFLTDGGDFSMNSERFRDNLPESITIRLDPAYYGKIDQFNERFNTNIPSLVGCQSLTIKGDVRFEADVTIKGDVTITNPRRHPAVIKAGTIIDEDIEI